MSEKEAVSRVLVKPEKTYAERVTAQYERVAQLMDAEKAHFFNEFIRGASLLENDTTHFLTQVETLSDKELAQTVSLMQEDAAAFMDETAATAIYTTFEKIKEVGRTKLFVWDEGSYREIEVADTEKNLLPWAGEVRAGGPQQSVTGIVGIAKDYNFELGDTFIEVNGHRFK